MGEAEYCFGRSIQKRVAELLREHPELSAMDAWIKTLAEQGWSQMKIARSLGIEEQTGYNHVSKMRKSR